MSDYSHDHAGSMVEPDPSMVEVLLARRLSSHPQVQAMPSPSCFEYLVKCVGMSFLRVVWLPHATIMSSHHT